MNFLRSNLFVILGLIIVALLGTNVDARVGNEAKSVPRALGDAALFNMGECAASEKCLPGLGYHMQHTFLGICLPMCWPGITARWVKSIGWSCGKC
jgi:hypothetical protein